MLTIRNPRNPNESIETSLTEQQAIDTLATLKSSFAQSLVTQYRTRGALSASQYYWAFKLAEEHKPQTPIKLHSDLSSWILQRSSENEATLLQFKVKFDDGDEWGKVFLRRGDGCVNVFSAYKFQGSIKGDEFYTERKTSPRIVAELLTMSENPQQWMQNYGRATGFCCVCGRELTNEESVSMGIGPICAGRFGF